MKRNAPPEVPIKTLLARLQADTRLTVSEKAALTYQYNESLSITKIGSMTSVALFAGGALSSCFNYTGLTATFFALGAIAGGATYLAQQANNESVAFLIRDYGQTPAEPKDP